MLETKEFQLAQQIIQLDIKRDELYEELMILIGSQAHELLRALQNYHGDKEERHSNVTSV